MATYFRVFIRKTACPENIYKTLGDIYLVEPSVSVQGGPARNNNEVAAIVVAVTRRSDRKDLVYFDHEVTPRVFGEELSIPVIDQFEMGGEAKRYVTVFNEKLMARKLGGKEYGMLPHIRERVHTFGSGKIFRARYPASEDCFDDSLMLVVGTRSDATNMEIELIKRLREHVGRFAISKETLLEEFEVAEDSKIRS